MTGTTQHSTISGVLFDFIGYLTTRKKRLVLSATDNAVAAADAVADFCELRGVSTLHADVKHWQDDVLGLGSDA